MQLKFLHWFICSINYNQIVSFCYYKLIIQCIGTDHIAVKSLQKIANFVQITYRAPIDFILNGGTPLSFETGMSGLEYCCSQIEIEKQHSTLVLHITDLVGALYVMTCYTASCRNATRTYIREATISIRPGFFSECYTRSSKKAFRQRQKALHTLNLSLVEAAVTQTETADRNRPAGNYIRFFPVSQINILMTPSAFTNIYCQLWKPVSSE